MFLQSLDALQMLISWWNAKSNTFRKRRLFWLVFRHFCTRIKQSTVKIYKRDYVELLTDTLVCYVIFLIRLSDGKTAVFYLYMYRNLYSLGEQGLVLLLQPMFSLSEPLYYFTGFHFLCQSPFPQNFLPAQPLWIHCENHLGIHL